MTPGRTAIIFPGMGPMAVAERARFLLLARDARTLLEAADEALGYDLVGRCLEGPGDYSECAQVAFLVACLALADWARRELGLEPDLCVGPSFGGKSAAAFTGALGFPEAVRLTALMARCEQEYFRTEHADVVTQSVARTPLGRLGEVLAGLAEHGEWYDLSAQVDDDFFLISVRESALEELLRGVRAIGGLPLYAMRPPIHSAAFAALRRKAQAEVFSEFHFADPFLPIVSDQDGSLVTSGEGVRDLLLDAIVRPVRWSEAVRVLREELAVARVCVAGPDALWGRIPCVTRSFTVLTADPRAASRPRGLSGAAEVVISTRKESEDHVG